MKLTVFLAAVLALVLAGPIAAQNDTQANQPGGTSDLSMTGTVVSHDGNQLVVTTDTGSRMTFTVDEGILPDGIGEGDRVRISYSSAAGGMYQAISVSEVGAENDRTGMVGTDRTDTDDLRDDTSTPGTTGSETGTMSDTRTNATDTGTSSTTTTNDRYGSTSTTTTTDPYGTSSTTGTDRGLPGTASPLPLVGMAGLLSVGAGLGLRYLRRRSG